MLSMKIAEAEKTVYVDVSGYITTKEANEFLNSHKQNTRNLRNSQYKLIVTPSVFQCESDEDIKKMCISLYKSGYKKIYLLDPNDYIMKTISLSSFEKKLFTKAVKTVKTTSEIR